MKIRPMRESDRDAYLAMSGRFYQSGAAAEPIPQENFIKTFEEILSPNPRVQGILLEEDGAPAGYALYVTYWSCETGGLTVFLDELYVEPQHRGKGMASQALRYLEEQNPQATALRLEVCESNQSAIRLYQRMGYEFMSYRSMRKLAGR